MTILETKTLSENPGPQKQKSILRATKDKCVRFRLSDNKMDKLKIRKIRGVLTKIITNIIMGKYCIDYVTSTKIL